MLARRSPPRLTRSRQRELALATVNPSDPGSPLSDWDGQSSSTSGSRNLHGHARPQQERRRVRLSGRLASKEPESSRTCSPSARAPASASLRSLSIKDESEPSGSRRTANANPRRLGFAAIGGGRRLGSLFRSLKEIWLRRCTHSSLMRADVPSLSWVSASVRSSGPTTAITGWRASARNSTVAVSASGDGGEGTSRSQHP